MSKTSAVLGTMVQIKPIIIMDDNGCLKVVGKRAWQKEVFEQDRRQAGSYRNIVSQLWEELAIYQQDAILARTITFVPVRVSWISQVL